MLFLLLDAGEPHHGAYPSSALAPQASASVERRLDRLHREFGATLSWAVSQRCVADCPPSFPCRCQRAAAVLRAGGLLPAAALGDPLVHRLLAAHLALLPSLAAEVFESLSAHFPGTVAELAEVALATAR